MSYFEWDDFDADFEDWEIEDEEDYPKNDHTCKYCDGSISESGGCDCQPDDKREDYYD